MSWERIVEGVVTAIVTPYKDNGEIDLDVFANLIRHQLDGNINGILVGGSTGEGSLITNEEFALLLQTANKCIQDKIPLLASCSAPGTVESIKRAKIAKEHGVSHLLTTAPYYVRPQTLGLFLHLEGIAKATDLPVIFYHHPGRTGINLNSFQLQNILDLPFIAGIKDSSLNLEALQTLEFRNDQALYCGDDVMTLPFMSIGAKGSISVISNLFPLEYGEIIRFCLENKMEEARAEWKKFQPFMGPLFKEGNPSGIKAALSFFGLCSKELRLPLIPPSQGTLDDMEKKLHKIAHELSISLLK